MEKNNSFTNGSGENGKWITVNGSHIFIEDGQSVEDAMNQKFNKSKLQNQIDQDKPREDKYVVNNNPDNINKATTISHIAKDIETYKGTGMVAITLPGGKWAQINPQEDGTFLARCSGGKKYFSNVEDAKKFITDSFGVSPKQAKDYATGDGHLNENGGYQGVSNVKSAPAFEYKSDPYIRGAKFKNPAGVEFEIVDVSNNKQGIPFVKIKDSKGEFEIEKSQLERLGWLK